jgi:branched-subunit amino acid aminotransferase/4-amino-4-deoxychorismate lyase
MTTRIYMPISYFKNRFLPESECHISINDRSFRFGDGIFDTCLVVNGRIYDFESHLKRLQNGLAAYKITLDTTDLENLCYSLIEKNSLTSGYARIIVSRGENRPGALGYLPKDANPYLIIQTSEKPYPAFKPLKLFLSSQIAAFKPPSKTNNSLLYTLAMLEAQENGCDNALLFNNNGNICETASGNIFWIKDNILYTPSLELELIAGTMREKLLNLWDGEKHEGKFTLHDLKSADEVFMSNIATIIAPITEIAPIGDKWPIGKNTTLLRQKLDNDIMSATSQK